MRRSRQARRSGINSIELLIALLILLLVSAGIFRVLMSGYLSSETITEQNRMQALAQRAADTIVDSIRGAARFTSGTGSQVAVEFPNHDTLRYYLEGTALTCESTVGGVAQQERIICDNALALNISMYTTEGADWDITTSLWNAQAARISVTVDENGRYRATEASAVKLRNKW